MAWIYNKKTGLLTECTNKDVIKTCKNDVKNYIVDQDVEVLKKTIGQMTSTEEAKETKTPLSKMKVDELKDLASELGLTADGLTADELRKIIKEAQGK